MHKTRLHSSSKQLGFAAVLWRLRQCVSCRLRVRKPIKDLSKINIFWIRYNKFPNSLYRIKFVITSFRIRYNELKNSLKRILESVITNLVEFIITNFRNRFNEFEKIIITNFRIWLIDWLDSVLCRIGNISVM